MEEIGYRETQGYGLSAVGSPNCDNAYNVRNVTDGGRTWWNNNAYNWNGVAPDYMGPIK